MAHCAWREMKKTTSFFLITLSILVACKEAAVEDSLEDATTIHHSATFYEWDGDPGIGGGNFKVPPINLPPKRPIIHVDYTLVLIEMHFMAYDAKNKAIANQYIKEQTAKLNQKEREVFLKKVDLIKLELGIDQK